MADIATAHDGSGPPGRALGRWLRRVCLATVDLVVPPSCAACGQDIEPTDEGPLLCDSCRGEFAPEPWATCRHCGAPAVGYFTAVAVGEGRSTAADSCPCCRNREYSFDGVISLGPYRGELRRAVLRMKRRTGDHLARAVGDLLGQRRGAELAILQADVVVPIPMHWFRQMVRGTNSPEIMAARLSRRLGVPLERPMLVRHRRTQPQADLSPTRRFENVRGAFRLGRGYAIKDASILLVDDIMTTGATCSEAAKVLKKAGARTVFTAIAARTVSGT